MSGVGGGGIGTILLGLIGAIVAGAAWGLLNGFLVAKGGLPSLIVTLGTLGMALGCALLITKGFDLTRPAARDDRQLRHRPALRAGAVHRDRRGDRRPLRRHPARVHALRVAHLRDRLEHRGRPPRRHQRRPPRDGRVHPRAARSQASSGFLSLARFGTTSVAGHAFDNLQVITGVVLGGTSLFGGVGTIFGTTIGVFIPVTLNNGLVIEGVQPFWQQVVTGAILILAVYVDQVRRKRQSRI